MTLRNALRTIDLARAAGISVQQVRNYEALGLLPSASRSKSGYRLYTQQPSCRAQNRPQSGRWLWLAADADDHAGTSSGRPGSRACDY